MVFLHKGPALTAKFQSSRPCPSDSKETRSDRDSRKDQLYISEVRNITTKGDMEGQQNPNDPGKHNAPGQQGGQQQEERERQERERQQREREKQGGGGGGQERGGGQQGGR